MTLNTRKHINYTEEEIEEYLKIVKRNVKKGMFNIINTQKREKNRKFIEKYKIASRKQKEIILSLKAHDFCYSVDNYHVLNEKLYIFVKEFELDNWGKIEKVSIYIKIAIKENEFIVIISFHEPEKKINKLFYTRRNK